MGGGCWHCLLERWQRHLASVRASPWHLLSSLQLSHMLLDRPACTLPSAQRPSRPPCCPTLLLTTRRRFQRGGGQLGGGGGRAAARRQVQVSPADSWQEGGGSRRVAYLARAAQQPSAQGACLRPLLASCALLPVHTPSTHPCRSGEAFLKPSVAATAAALAAAPAALRAPGGGAFKNPGGAAFKKPGGPGGTAAAGAAAAPKAPPQAHALHDPRAEGAIVLNAAQWDGRRGSLARDRPVSPVVVDPYLGRHLRPHQVGAAAGASPSWAGSGLVLGRCRLRECTKPFGCGTRALRSPTRHRRSFTCPGGGRALPVRGGHGHALPRPLRLHPGGCAGWLHAWVAGLGSGPGAAAVPCCSCPPTCCCWRQHCLSHPTRSACPSSSHSTRRRHGAGQDAAGAGAHLDAAEAGAGGAPACEGGAGEGARLALARPAGRLHLRCLHVAACPLPAFLGQPRRAGPRCAARSWSRPPPSARTVSGRWGGQAAAASRHAVQSGPLPQRLRSLVPACSHAHSSNPTPRTLPPGADEVRKWLGAERLKALVISPNGNEGKQQVGGAPGGGTGALLLPRVVVGLEAPPGCGPLIPRRCDCTRPPPLTHPVSHPLTCPPTTSPTSRQVVDFKHGSVHRVAVVSYETLRKHSADLAGSIDLLVGCRGGAMGACCAGLAACLRV